MDIKMKSIAFNLADDEASTSSIDLTYQSFGTGEDVGNNMNCNVRLTAKDLTQEGQTLDDLSRKQADAIGRSVAAKWFAVVDIPVTSGDTTPAATE
jgi:aromatic ring hydroxylase